MKIAKAMRRWGWVIFRLMWIPFIAIFIGMWSLPEGEYDWVELPMLARVSMVAAGSLAALALILLVGASVAGLLANRSLQENGLPAQAKILRVWDTGTTINQDPLIRMLLEINPPGEPPFQAETERLISRLQIPQIQPGMVVDIKYDPTTKAVALADAESAE